MVDNLRFPKVMVGHAGNIVNVVGNRPYQLALNQIGFYNPATGLAIDPSAAYDGNSVVLHQNVGDTSFGTVRSEVIFKNKILRMLKRVSKAKVEQVTVLSKPCVPCDKDITVTITVYEKSSIGKIYNPAGLTYRLPIYTGCCAADGSNPAGIGLAFYNKLAALINGTEAVGQDYGSNLELKNYLTAVVTGADDATATLTITGKTPPAQTISTCLPDQTYEPRFTHFTVHVETGHCACADGTNLQVTTPGNPANGLAIEVASMEKESQGYDRVRNVYSENRYMKPNFIIKAIDGNLYTSFYVEFERQHTKMGVQNGGIINEPYALLFFGHEGSDAVTEFETFFEDWTERDFETL